MNYRKIPFSVSLISSQFDLPFPMGSEKSNFTIKCNGSDKNKVVVILNINSEVIG